MSTLALICLFVVSCLVILVLPALSQGTVLCGAVVLRSLSDIGASSTGSLLPSSLISTGIGVLLIAVALLPRKPRLPPSYTRAIAIITSVLVLSAVVFAVRYSSVSGAIAEPVRVLSIVAVYVLAYRYSMTSPGTALRALVVAPLVAATTLIIGAVVGWAPVMLSGGRAAGTFSHPNSAAAFFSVAFLICMGLSVSHRSRTWLIAGLGCFGALLLTQSLGGLLSALAGVVLFVLLRTELTAIKKLLFMLAITVITFIVFVYTGFSERLDEINDLDISGSLAVGVSENSLEWRLINWREYLEIFASNPWIGTGSGSTYGQIMPLGGPPHSIFIEFLVEYGLFGFTIFSCLIFVIVKVLISRLSMGWAPGLALSLIFLLIINGSESNLFGYTAAMYYTAMAFGVLATFCRPNSKTLATKRSKDYNANKGLV